MSNGPYSGPSRQERDITSLEDRVGVVERDYARVDERDKDIVRRLGNVEQTITKLMWGAWALAGTFLMLAVAITVAVVNAGGH